MPKYVKGSVNQILQIHILDTASTVGAGKTGLTNASVTAHYRRVDDGDAGGVAISLTAGTRGTYSSGGFKEVDATNMPGTYELGLPSAMLATGAEEVSLHINGTGVRMAPLRIQLLEPVSELFQQVVTGGGAPTWDAGSAGETLKDLNDKMPTNFIMGSSDASDQDDNVAAIDAAVTSIKSVTDLLPDAGALTTIEQIAQDWTDGGRLDLILDSVGGGGGFTGADRTLLTTLHDDWADGGRLDLILDDIDGDVDTIVVEATQANLRAGQLITELAVVDGIVDDILADTNELQTDLADGGRVDLLIDSIISLAAGINADTNIMEPIISNLPDAGALTSIEAAAQDWLDGGRLDLLLDSAAAGGSPAAVATEVYDQANFVDGRSLREINQLIVAVLAGKSSGATDMEGAQNIIYRNLQDTLDRVDATTDHLGNRNAVTRNYT